MLHVSVVIQVLKKSVMFLCTPFANCCIDSDWLEITLHNSSTRQVPPFADSPDQRSVCNKEVKLI